MKKSPRLRRQYYIHENIQSIVSLDVAKRTVYLTESEFKDLDEKTQIFISELRDEYRYIIQTFII